MQYLKWLQVLIALGPKLPAILAALQALFDAIAAAKPAEAEGSLEMVQPSTAELEAEAQVACLVAGPTAAFDGTRLRRLFKFLESSGLLDALLKTLAGG